MKRSTILNAFLFFAFITSFAQSDALMQQIAKDKQEAASKGFTLLDSGGFGTNNDLVMQFDIHDFYAGSDYLLVYYIEGCSMCEPGMYFENTNTWKVQEFYPNYVRSDKTAALRANYNFTQQNYVRGNLCVYSKTSSKYYTYGMLFKK